MGQTETIVTGKIQDQRIKIQQEMQATKGGPWITSKSRIIFDFELLQKNGSGMESLIYTRFYT